MADLQRATVVAAQVLSPHVREIVLKPESTVLEYLPGQWLSLRLPVGENPPLNRAYTLARPMSPDGALTFCFDRVEDGVGSNYLWDIAVGETVEFTGPHGNFVFPESNTPVLLVARYTGIVPFFAMLHALPAEGTRPVRLLYGVPDASEAIYHAALEGIAASCPWLTYIPVAAGEEIEAIEKTVAGWETFSPMVCGVREFTLPVRNFLMERYGLDRRAIKVENYSGPGR